MIYTYLPLPGLHLCLGFVGVPVLHGFFFVCVWWGARRVDRVLLSSSSWNLLCRPSLPLSCSRFSSLWLGNTRIYRCELPYPTCVVYPLPIYFFCLYVVVCGGNRTICGHLFSFLCGSQAWTQVTRPAGKHLCPLSHLANLPGFLFVYFSFLLCFRWPPFYLLAFEKNFTSKNCLWWCTL